MNKFILPALLLWSSGAMAGQLTTEEKVRFFYPNIVKQVQNHGLSGPIAQEVAQYAQLRDIHENGPTRPHNISYNGMGIGPPNNNVIQNLHCPDLKITTVATNDGIGSYGFIGPRAHIMSSVAIALWYDMIINSARYRVCNDEERRIWNESRHCSHMIAIDHPEVLYQVKFDELRDRREKIIKKVNNAYGPEGASIARLKERLWPK